MVMMRAPRDGEVCWSSFVIDYRVVGLIDECLFLLFPLQLLLCLVCIGLIWGLFT